MLGPIDYIAVGFPGNKFNGEILSELGKVIDKGLVRVIDLLFLTKDESGEVTVLELSNMPQDVQDAFGPLSDELTGLLSQDDALEVAKDLGNNSSAGVLVFEQVWAKGFKQALLNADGVLLGQGRIDAEAVDAALEEIKAEA